MNTTELKKIFQTIQKNFHCPNCGKNYFHGDIHLVSFSGNVCFLRLICSCQTPVIATVAITSDNELPLTEDKIDANDLLKIIKIVDNIESVNELIN